MHRWALLHPPKTPTNEHHAIDLGSRTRHVRRDPSVRGRQFGEQATCGLEPH